VEIMPNAQLLIIMLYAAVHQAIMAIRLYVVVSKKDVSS
jgi:hypothetical protein